MLHVGFNLPWLVSAFSAVDFLLACFNFLFIPPHASERCFQPVLCKTRGEKNRRTCQFRQLKATARKPFLEKALGLSLFHSPKYKK